MKSKIYNFLKERGGTASALTIARSLLHMRGGSAASAQKLLAGMLGNDHQFIYDGLGNWHINPEAAKPDAETSALAGRFYFAAFAADANDIRFARTVELAFVEVAEMRVIDDFVLEIDFAAGLASQRQTWQQFKERFDPRNILVAETPDKIRRLLERTAILAGERASALWELRLPVLAQQILEFPRRPSISRICKALEVPDIIESGPQEKAKQGAEILLHLLERARARGISGKDELLRLGRPVGKKVSFERFAFNAADIRNLPETPGVYLMRNRDNDVIYIGKAKNLRARLADYFIHAVENEQKLGLILQDIRTLEWQPLDTELDALIEEAVLIRRYKPAINKQQNLGAARFPQKYKGSRIVTLLSAQADIAVVYLFSANGKFERIACRQNRLPLRKLEKSVRSICYSPGVSVAHPVGKNIASSIAWQWWHANRERVNWLDPITLGEPEQCLAILVRYLDDFANLREKMIRQ